MRIGAVSADVCSPDLDRQVGEHGARADALQAVDADVAYGEAAVGSDSRRERVRGGLGRRDAERGLRIDCFLCPGGGGRDGRGEGKDKQAAGGGTRHQIGSRWESWPRRWAVGAGLDSYRTKLRSEEHTSELQSIMRI